MWLEIGKIVGVQGLKGELRIYPNSDFPERFLEPGQRWLLRPGMTEPEPIELLSGRYLTGKGLYVVQLAGIADRTHAETLRDSRLVVPETDRPPLEEDEFHVLDLIGLEVFQQTTQTHIGTVVDVLSAGNDLLEVQLREGYVPQSSELDSTTDQELDDKAAEVKAKSKSSRQTKTTKTAKAVLIPFVKAIVPVVDLEQKRIEITPPPGLLDG